MDVKGLRMDDFSHRNLLWMSPEVQRLVVNSHLVVVGCGGNGVVFVMYAAHLGFRKFTLCDPDILEVTNLNRYIISSRDDIGRPKVEIIRDYLLDRFPNVSVDCLCNSFPSTEIISQIPSADMVIGCLDNVFYRIELDILCRKYNRRLIDLGSGFIIEDSVNSLGVILGAGGQILVSRPGSACLRCLGFDLNVTKNSYFVPESATNDISEASSLLLNSIVGSLAVECTIKEICNKLFPTNRIMYDRESLTISQRSVPKEDMCQICGDQSESHINSIMEISDIRNLILKEDSRCRIV